MDEQTKAMEFHVVISGRERTVSGLSELVRLINGGARIDLIKYGIACRDDTVRLQDALPTSFAPHSNTRIIDMTGIVERGHDDDCSVVPMSELKPCPFCQHTDIRSMIGIRGDRGFSMLCGGCGIRQGSAGRTKAEAITAWNARTPDPEAPEAAFRLALENVESWRRGEVQAIGAAISTRNWQALEATYNQLRDKMDHILAIDPAQHLGRE